MGMTLEIMVRHLQKTKCAAGPQKRGDCIVTQIRNRVCRVLDFDLFPSPSRASSHRTPATAQSWSQSHILPHINRFGPTHLSASRISVHLQKKSRRISQSLNSPKFSAFELSTSFTRSKLETCQLNDVQRPSMCALLVVSLAALERESSVSLRRTAASGHSAIAQMQDMYLLHTLG